MTLRARAFSLIELVIVIVIIGIIGAIAIPRMSRGAAGAADGALVADLARLRNAIDLFHAEHNSTYPAIGDLVNALTQYSNEAGTSFSATKDGANGIIYGPYLREIPKLPVGADKGKSTFVAAYAAGNGWVYDATTGEVRANCAPAEKDARGVPYNTY
ncbi:MAG: prepilin-type N-terminal cleavage/methylation domain-containing protein [Phycisphaerae bacterium]|nr:prepilin-type N-terminal cleavage/methylation domain-containing protein [Phycisphaerae bacterium]